MYQLVDGHHFDLTLSLFLSALFLFLQKNTKLSWNSVRSQIYEESWEKWQHRKKAFQTISKFFWNKFKKTHLGRIWRKKKNKFVVVFLSLGTSCFVTNANLPACFFHCCKSKKRIGESYLTSNLFVWKSTKCLGFPDWGKDIFTTTPRKSQTTTFESM